MAGDESDKSAEEVLRDSIKASSMAASSAKEALDSTGDPLRDALRQGVVVAGEDQTDRAFSPGWQEPTEDEFNKKWLTPSAALSYISAVYRESSAKRWIMGRLKSGYILAVARQSEWRGNLTTFVPVPKGCWLGMTDWGDDFFWETGDTSFHHKGYKASLFDVRFETLWGGPPASLPNQMLEAQEAKSGARRGAKRKDWWDLLWIEMIRRIRAGTLKPKSKAELQGILEDYVSELGENYGDSTLKPMASNLFKYLEEIRGK